MERARVFGTSGSLVGIITPPDSAHDGPATPLGVVFLNAGIVHRAGPHRLYVRLARAMAGAGAAALRFDHAGIGDSPRRQDDAPFRETAVQDARDAMDVLAREFGCARFVLVGLCSGTLSAFRSACQDTRVTGLVLLNALLEEPSCVDEGLIRQALEARTARSYVTEKVLAGGSWRRLLTGRVSPKKLARVLGRTLFRKAASAPPPSPGTLEVRERLASLAEREVRVLFIFGEPTTVLEFFRTTLEPTVREKHMAGSVDVHIVKRSDHTFTPLRDQEAILGTVGRWFQATRIA